MWYLWTKNIKGVTVKVEILDKGQSDPALEKTTKQLFCQSPASWWKLLPNILIHGSHRTMWHTTRPNNLQQNLPPACYIFYPEPLLSLFNSSPNICIKSESNIQTSNSETIKWGWRSGILWCSYLMGIDRPKVQCFIPLPGWTAVSSFRRI